MNERNYWLKVDRQKQAFERYYDQEFIKALNKQIDPILDNWEFMQVPDDVIRAAMNIKADPIESVYLDLYKRVPVEFGKYAVESLKEQTGELVTKNDGISTLLENPEAFTWIWSTQATSWVYQNVGDRIVSVTETSKKRVIQIVRQLTAEALEDGLSISETMAFLEDRIPVEWRKERWRANTIARTEVLTAANEGNYRGAIATGLQLKKRWLTRLDGRERDSHRLANGQTQELQTPYDVGGVAMMRPGDIRAPADEVINCYLPNTSIESIVMTGQKSFYSGATVEIITARGERLTITPNHNILTDKGFIPAKSIKIGDNVLCNSIEANRSRGLVQNYIQKKITTAQNIFSALRVFGISKFTQSIALDFDGDGQAMNGNIEIVDTESQLLINHKSRLGKFIAKLILQTTFFKGIEVSRFRPEHLFSSAYNSTSSRFMSLLVLAFPRLFIHLRPFNLLTFGLASKLNVSLLKSIRDSSSANSKLLAEFINTHPGVVSLDQIVDIREGNFVGHVYDFTSLHGINIANNIYTSNCRCVEQYIRADREN